MKTSSLKIQCVNVEQSGKDDEGEFEFSSELGPIVHRAATAFGGWLLGLSGTETAAVSDWEEGEPRIFFNFGYKNICKKKCCYKCCEVNKIIWDAIQCCREFQDSDMRFHINGLLAKWDQALKLLP